MRLGHLDHMDQRHPNPEDHPKVKWEKSLCLDHAKMPIFGHLAKTQFTNDHLRSNSIDTLLVPKLGRGKILGSFGPTFYCRTFIEHLRYLCFSENSILQSLGSLWDFCFVVFLPSLQTQRWKPCSVWCPE